MIYHWRAVDTDGSIKTGELESLSPTVAEQQLKSRGFRSIEIGAKAFRGGTASGNVGTIFVALAILAWIGAGVFFVVGQVMGKGAEAIVSAVALASTGLMLYAVGAVIGLLREAVDLLRVIASRK